jgi:hypothetical protein
MTVSEAFDIFSKWVEESSPVAAGLFDDGESVQCVMAGSLSMEFPAVEVEAKNGCSIRVDLSKAKKIDYGDYRVAPPEDQPALSRSWILSSAFVSMAD